MRIGIDGGCLSNRRGFGRFARRMIEALAREDSSHDFSVFVDRPSAESVSIPERFRKTIVEVREAPGRAAKAGGRRGIGDILAMSRAVAQSRLDLFYFPASYSFFPVWNVARTVVTLHDTLALRHPEWVFPGGRGRFAWMFKEYAAVWSADAIVTVSEASKRDLISWFRLDPDRVRVVGEGADPIFEPKPAENESSAVLSRYEIDPERRFLLYVGGLSPHKNLGRLIEAFGRIKDGRPDVDLVLVGDFHDVFHTNVPELRAIVDRLRLNDRVRFAGFVPDDDLVWLYGRAYALVQPSLLEGFGLPAVEALACGTPVLSSRAGSLPEVVGAAGLFFEPTDIDDMASTIGGFLDRPGERRRLAALAASEVKRHSWSQAAKTLLECFERTIATQGKAA